MMQYFGFFLQEALFSVNVLTEYNWKVLYELLSVTIIQCRKSSVSFGLSSVIWEKLLEDMMVQLMGKKANLEPQISRLLGQVSFLDGMPRGFPALFKDTVRDGFWRIYQNSKVACEFILISWSQSVNTCPGLALKLLTPSFEREVFRILGEFQIVLTEGPPNDSAWLGREGSNEKNLMLFCFILVQFVNQCLAKMDREFRVGFVTRNLVEITALSGLIPIAAGYEAFLEEWLVFYMAAVFTLNDTRTPDTENVLLERLLEIKATEFVSRRFDSFGKPQAKEISKAMKEAVGNYQLAKRYLKTAY
jgi:hypothetical protein